MSSPASLEDVNILDILGQNNTKSNHGNYSNTSCSESINSISYCSPIQQTTPLLGTPACWDTSTVDVTPGSPPSYTARYPPCQLESDTSFPLVTPDGAVLEQNVEHNHRTLDMEVLENLDLFLEHDFISTLQLDQVNSRGPITMKESNSTVRLTHMTIQQPITTESEEQTSSPHIEPDDLTLAEHILSQFSTGSSILPGNEDCRDTEVESTKIETADLRCDLDRMTFDLDDLSTAENILDECMDTSFSLDCDTSLNHDISDLDSLDSSNLFMSTVGGSESLDSGYGSNSIMSPSQFEFSQSSRCATPESAVFQTDMSHNTSVLSHDAPALSNNAPDVSAYNNIPSQEQLIAACMQMQSHNEQKKQSTNDILSHSANAQAEPECIEIIEDPAECSGVTEDDIECSKVMDNECTKVKVGARSKKKKDRKPYDTYVALIAKAMLASGKMRLTLGEIYEQVG